MRGPRGGGRERGSAAVLAVVLIGVLVTVAVLLAAVGGAVVDQRRVGAAADLGALAGASAAQRGDDPCTAARAVVRDNHARLAACAVAGEVVTVHTDRRTRPVLGLRVTVASQARAGPGTLVGP
jgi:secretion/DNA translocation related TadE-like protein